MTGLGKVVRTTAFKLSLLYLVLFSVVAAATTFYIYLNAKHILDEQINSSIENEIQSLANQYARGGPRALVNTVNRRSQNPGSFLYLIVTANGIKLSGNVGALEPEILAHPGVLETNYNRIDEGEPQEHRAIINVFVLNDGTRLLVGRDVEERGRLYNAMLRAYGWAFFLLCVFGVTGGWFVISRVLKRVDGMTETTRTIVAGDISGRLAVIGSGDELDRLALNLNAMLDRIGELMTGLREVSDNIAHDLKTPLTRLRNRADEALRTAKSKDELRAALEANIDESDNLIRVFNALLTIARLEAGSGHAALADFDAADVARDVAELYEPLVEDAGATVTVSIIDGLPVHGNRELLGQALSNLIDNALKYGACADGQPTAITIAAEKSGKFIEITVSDKGAGIPENERERVTERFVRLEGSRTKPGFGLGLSMVAAVARLHDGQLVLGDNTPGLKAILRLPERQGETDKRELTDGA